MAIQAAMRQLIEVENTVVQIGTILALNDPTGISDRDQGVLVAIIGLQLALLVLRRQSGNVRTSASLAADLLSILATLMLGLQSCIDQQQSHRASSLGALYLSACTLLGIAKARTLWQIGPGEAVSTILITILALSVVYIMLDSLKRTAYQKAVMEKFSPEQYSGFWDRAVFAWLVTTFRIGYFQVISVDDLPALDTKLASGRAHGELLSTRETCKCCCEQSGSLLMNRRRSKGPS